MQGCKNPSRITGYRSRQMLKRGSASCRITAPDPAARVNSLRPTKGLIQAPLKARTTSMYLRCSQAVRVLRA